MLIIIKVMSLANDSLSQRILYDLNIIFKRDPQMYLSLIYYYYYYYLLLLLQLISRLVLTQIFNFFSN
jgi:hypothetical protein